MPSRVSFSMRKANCVIFSAFFGGEGGGMSAVAAICENVGVGGAKDISLKI